MNKKDIFLSVFVGILTGFIWGAVFSYLGTLDKFGLGWAVWVLVLVVPLVYLAGLFFGEWLSRKIPFFKSFAKYVMVGFLNTGVDFAVFNFLMFITKIEQGYMVSSFKTISFVAAVTNSYFWNKNWVFEERKSALNKGKEFTKFIVVNVIGAMVNVIITSVLIFTIMPKFGLSQLSWNNIAAVFGTAVALIWNFIGFKLIVFTKKNEPSPISKISA